jgi:hypothetical protein
MFLYKRDELLHDRIPIGTTVLRIHGVGIIIVGTGMLECDIDHTGTLIGHPIFRELRGSLRPGIVFAGSFEVKSAGRSQGKVALDVIDRKIHIGMFLIAFGQEDCRPQIDGLSPEVCKDFALEFDALDPRSVFGNFDGGNDIFAAQRYGFGLGGIDLDLDHIADDVSGRAVPTLALPLVIVHPNGMAISALEFRIDIYDSLDIVLSWGNVLYALERISKHLMIEDHFFASMERFHIFPEKRDAMGADLQSGFPDFAFCDDDEYTPCDGSIVSFGRVRNGEFQLGMRAGSSNG